MPRNVAIVRVTIFLAGIAMNNSLWWRYLRVMLYMMVVVMRRRRLGCGRIILRRSPMGWCLVKRGAALLFRVVRSSIIWYGGVGRFIVIFLIFQCHHGERQSTQDTLGIVFGWNGGFGTGRLIICIESAALLSNGRMSPLQHLRWCPCHVFTKLAWLMIGFGCICRRMLLLL